MTSRISGIPKQISLGEMASPSHIPLGVLAPPSASPWGKWHPCEPYSLSVFGIPAHSDVVKIGIPTHSDVVKISIIMIQVKHCEVCQKSKRKFDKPAAPLHPVPVSDTWNKLGIDLIELPITPRGNR